MVATGAALRHRRATKLTGPHDQRIVPQAASFQVFDQRGAWSIDLFGFQLHSIFHATVMIPVFVIELNKTHAAFGQPTRQ